MVQSKHYVLQCTDMMDVLQRAHTHRQFGNCPEPKQSGVINITVSFNVAKDRRHILKSRGGGVGEIPASNTRK
jgi:hypothetical protein